MKLAEALQERADIQRKIEEYRSRINNNVIVQEGETPPEDPKTLIEEMDSCIKQLEILIGRINKTNCNTQTEKGTLTELIAKRDCLQTEIGIYQGFLGVTAGITRRATRTEIKILNAISVKDYRKKCDDLSKELREIENLIQSTNWTTELI